jgi:hypothetical protein
MRSAKLKAAVAAALLTTVAFAAPALATPYVDIRSNFGVYEDPLYTAPAGVAISCSGDASAITNGCGGGISLSTTVTDSAHLSASFHGGLVITNTTNAIIDAYLSFHTYFSAFNPGGPNVGISIDDPLTEGARFSSSQSGEGIGDSHSCSIGLYGESGRVFSPTTCGVGAPDSSDYHFAENLANLAPGASMTIPYLLQIDADFILPPGDPNRVPEPASALVLLSGVAGLYLKRRCG